MHETDSGDSVWLDFAENAPVSLQSVGPDGRVLWANRAHVELLGYAQEEVIGSHLGRFHADPAICEAFLGRLAAGETLRDYPAPLRHRDGSIRHVLISANVSRVGGRFHHTRCFLRDVTEKRRLEQALEERARALTLADRLKDEFLANLSHELRTPLNAILGWSRLLRANRLDQRKREDAIATIERNAVAQARLIDELLDVARIASGKLTLDVRPLDLAEVVASAVESAGPAARAKSITICASIDPSASPFAGDRQRLGQVMWNLVSNALKFTPRGGRIEVTLARTDGHARITVHDTGPGMDPSFLPHVFERFRQSDAGVARTHGGLGLGLAIAHHLVALHGGQISAQSPGLGRGSTFTVTLPLLAAASPGTPRDGVAALPTLRDALAGVRVLVVEDNADARELVTEILALAGARVELASSAEEALARVRDRAPDVLVSDIGLPIEDGYALLERVRRDGCLVPAIALTAYARAEDRERARGAGYDAHLPKPIDPAELVSMVVRLGTNGSRPE
jgi:PAS domain S-box-containing protein